MVGVAFLEVPRTVSCKSSWIPGIGDLMQGLLPCVSLHTPHGEKEKGCSLWGAVLLRPALVMQEEDVHQGQGQGHVHTGWALSEHQAAVRRAGVCAATHRGRDRNRRALGRKQPVGVWGLTLPPPSSPTPEPEAVWTLRQDPQHLSPSPAGGFSLVHCLLVPGPLHRGALEMCRQVLNQRPSGP